MSDHPASDQPASDPAASDATAERLRRWKLLLGSASDDADGTGVSLNPADATMNRALGDLYDSDARATKGRGGLGSSAPRLSRWLGDIRTYFPSTVVNVLQTDAIKRHNLTQLLLEPEVADTIEPDVALVSALIGLSSTLSETSRQTARMVVGKVVAQVEKRIGEQTRAAVRGALHRAARVTRPRPGDIDWNRTIAANLKNYLPEYRTVVPQRLIGYGRRVPAVRKHFVLAVDQSGSMADSVVYSAIFGAVLASIRAARTSMVVFDTQVADLTEQLVDPIEVLFSTQLGGGTDINAAVAYCQGLITSPRDTVFVLISDLYEGGVAEQLLARMAELRAAGVQAVTLLALSDSGAPAYDRELAAQLVELGVPSFACTPDAFPDLLAAALNGDNLMAWADRYESDREHGLN
ncbi:VWA domain-containing protein [Granulicoccus phenolivorans]|uniref:VWA domain-containing protein n=1 Tax=Granulicoccus phenolivorans TaxID=266854 RepID=UPI0004057DB0|nr:VWA domain-containing protein [Granulicoccus phenolivorans]